MPYEGLSPTTPQYDAGRRTDPPVSVPSALDSWCKAKQVKQGDITYASHIPAATAAALPPELPPADLASDGASALDSWKGLTTAPWIEWTLSELCKAKATRLCVSQRTKRAQRAY